MFEGYGLYRTMIEDEAAKPTLTDDELETILIVARNGQSGRITKYEIEELVRCYRAWVSDQADEDLT